MLMKKKVDSTIDTMLIVDYKREIVESTTLDFDLKLIDFEFKN
jgi:hypothetical protein